MAKGGRGPEVEADCGEAVQQLYTYLDGELTEEIRLTIQVHLDNCPPCLDMFDFETELRRVIADRCKDRVPDQLRIRVAEAIAREASSREGRAR